uniref:EF-hand domain-containing protein n=1 Tax=Rhabditophanes sp. KR3021 TaxID=114890 RepID=A0AC35TSQ8_9BILA
MNDDTLQILDIIQHIDKIGDEHIFVFEVSVLLNVLGFYPTQSELVQLLASLGTDKDKRVGLNEIVPIFENLKKEREANNNDPLSAMTEILTHLDPDSTGKVKSTDLRYLLGSYGDQLEDAQIDELMSGLESDENGLISIDTFTNEFIKEI